MFDLFNPLYRVAAKCRSEVIQNFRYADQPNEGAVYFSHLKAVDHKQKWFGDCDDFAITACDYLRRLGYKPLYVEGWVPGNKGIGKIYHAYCFLPDGKGDGFVIDQRQAAVWRMSEMRRYGYGVTRQLALGALPVTYAQ